MTSTGRRILLSNDDGFDSSGLKLLERIARGLSDDVWVVAPALEQSGSAHSLTLRRPLRIRRVSKQRYSVDGTPTDCVLLAVKHILLDHPPDLVLAGINRGGNLGEDVTYSGTLAAAMEATLLGIPAIALSQHRDGRGPTMWKTAERFAPELLHKLIDTGWPPGVFININFPAISADKVSGVEVGFQGRRKLGDHLEERIDPHGRPYYWIGPLRREEASRKGSDLAAIERNAIAVTPLHLDLTHRATLRDLKKVLS
ncbi:MAG: 5'/3'-nucleotidase SurE [Alphaproteobacteria bacterium]|nr:5'/3'-nucleotidase SurE [Alphaproteobacteria bacterium]